MPRYADWREWLKVIVMAPNVVLLFVATWLWWPEDKKGWRNLLFVFLYLIALYAVMHYVFQFGLR